MSERPRRIRPTYEVWAALERYDVVKDAQGFREPTLPTVTGTVHALGKVIYRPSKLPEFYDYRGPFALCGDHVKVRLQVTFDKDGSDACERCAALVAEGKTRGPRSAYPRECDAVVRPNLDKFPQIVGCHLRDDHRGPHRGGSGLWWEGSEDFTPDGDYHLGDD